MGQYTILLQLQHQSDICMHPCKIYTHAMQRTMQQSRICTDIRSGTSLDPTPHSTPTTFSIPTSQPQPQTSTNTKRKREINSFDASNSSLAAEKRPIIHAQPAPTTTTASNPYKQQLQTAYEHFHNLVASVNEFKLLSTASRSVHYIKPTPQSMKSSMPITKGVAEIRKDYTLSQILDSLRNSAIRKQWDPRFEEMRIVDVYSDDRTEALIHSFQKGQWPLVPGRDFCVAMKVFKESDVQGVVLFTSVESDKIAPVKNRVRGFLYCAGFLVQKAADKWIITCITHADPKGLPLALLNKVIEETAVCVGNFAQFIEQTGPVPPD
ncbi:hypothetical protein BJ741DRAFT_604832 [Chytriomyces cf. hyalinus JEL632]|nr:hypothetical protein BJ741DRAFT_604832 [Chytriomyces cf. hyalinus JEL632]